MGETGQVEYEAQDEGLATVGQDEGMEPGAAAATAIVLAGKGVTLGDLLAVNPAAVEAAEIINTAVEVVTGGIAQQIVDSLAPITTIHEQLARLAMQPSLLEIVKSAGISGGHVLGEEAFRNRGIASAFYESETALNMPRLAGGIGTMVAGPVPSESYSRLFGVHEDDAFGFRDAIERMNRPFRDTLESSMNAHMVNWEGAHSRIFEEIRTERQRGQPAFDAILADIRNQRQQQAEDMQKTSAVIAQFRQQRSEETAAYYADRERLQFQSTLASQRWGIYKPELPADHVEVVQTSDQITLEGLNMALAEGKLPWREVMHLAMQHMPNAKPGQKEPPVLEQLSLVEGWEAVRGKMLQIHYCNKVGISRASLNRYQRRCKALGLI